MKSHNTGWSPKSSENKNKKKKDQEKTKGTLKIPFKSLVTSIPWHSQSFVLANPCCLIVLSIAMLYSFGISLFS